MTTTYLNIETKTFAWANNIEYLIETEDFQISNENSGLPSSSFKLEKGTYDIIISEEEKCEDGFELFFNGIPKLSGGEEQNLEMEELLGDEHQREYGLYKKDFYFHSYIVNDKEEFFVYLKKH